MYIYTCHIYIYIHVYKEKGEKSKGLVGVVEEGGANERRAGERKREKGRETFNSG
jgi:hypothetical protein